MQEPNALPKIPKRPRALGHDYSSAGYYFVTVCTHNRVCTLSNIVNFQPVLTPLGVLLKQSIDCVEQRFDNVQIDSSVIMPNHFHLIVRIDHADGMRIPLQRIINEIKGRTTVTYNKQIGTCGRPIWQYGFHDEIIRSERELFGKRKYVADNPVKWAVDRLNPNYRQAPCRRI